MAPQGISRSRYWNMKGECMLVQGRNEDAISFFQRSLIEDPGYTTARDNMKRTVHRIGKML